MFGLENYSEVTMKEGPRESRNGAVTRLKSLENADRLTLYSNHRVNYFTPYRYTHRLITAHTHTACRLAGSVHDYTDLTGCHGQLCRRLRLTVKTQVRLRTGQRLASLHSERLHQLTGIYVTTSDTPPSDRIHCG